MTVKLLLIDDDLTLLNLLSQYLRESGFQVVEASNGATGLRLAYSEKPELVLLDIMMPGMDGWEVCARIRELTDLPIIMLTAKTTEADKLRGFQLGVDDYVTKPFSFAELVARIQAVLGRMRTEKEEPRLLTHGDIVLDMEKFQVFVKGELVELTPIEFRLLEALVRRQGKVASEKDLMLEVWGGTRSDPALIRRYILMLRKKIEHDPANPVLILTARGFGYHLDNYPPRNNLDLSLTSKK